MKINKLRLLDKKLYLITNSDKFNSTDEFLDRVASALEGGVQVIQLREKTNDAKKIIEIGKRIRELCSIYNALFIVNDRIDIAQIVNADGIHLGQNDIDIYNARELVGENIIIGISTNSIEQAKKAQENGADYIFINTEISILKDEEIEIPYFIKINNFDIDIKAESRIAVMDAIINAPSPKKSAQDFIKKLNK